MLRSHLAAYKKTNNEVAIATIVVSGIRTRRRDTFFCSAKRKYPKKRRLDCRFLLRSSVLSGGGREGFLPSYRRTASMPRPFGLIPTKPVVLSAANESKTTLLRNISYWHSKIKQDWCQYFIGYKYIGCIDVRRRIIHHDTLYIVGFYLS